MRPLLRKAVGMWAILAVVMFGNGVLRVVVLQPRLGEELARAVATVLGVLIVFGLALLFVRRLERPTGRDLLKVGVLWLALTVLFEFGLGYFSGMSWEAMRADYDIARGRLWPLVLLSTLTAPWFWGVLGAAEGPSRPH